MYISLEKEKKINFARGFGKELKGIKVDGCKRTILGGIGIYALT